MAYWNHFAQRKYKQILFSSLKEGDKFRKGSFSGKRRRRDIICIKTGKLSSIEQKSKKENTYFRDDFEVSSFDELI